MAPAASAEDRVSARLTLICRNRPGDHKPWNNYECPDTFGYHDGEYESTLQRYERLKREGVVAAYAEESPMGEYAPQPAALDPLAALRQLMDVLERHPESYRLDSGPLGGDYAGAWVRAKAAILAAQRVTKGSNADSDPVDSAR